MKNLKKNKILFKELFIFTGFMAFAILSYFLALKFPFFKEVNKSALLSSTTQTLLQQFSDPIRLTLYHENIENYHHAKTLIERYQVLQPALQFQWQPQSLKQPPLPIHALILRYQQQTQVIDIDRAPLDENLLTQAFFKLQRKANQWVVFLQGHGEPSPFGTKQRDFSLFRLALENQGIKVQTLNLQHAPFIPENTQVLIVASPLSALLPNEEELLLNYIMQGKDLLWLMDPQSHSLSLFNGLFNISALPGILVDLHGQNLGTPHPAITIIDNYPPLPFHPPETLTAFPWAVALKYKSHPSWRARPLLVTHENTWTETGDIQGEIAFDPEVEIAGPHFLGLTLSSTQSQQQRIAVIGNSRFLSNGAIENYGNLAFGLGLINWLNHDDMLIHISQPIAEGSFLHMQTVSIFLIRYMYPVFFPGILLLFALLSIYRSRRLS